MKNQRLFNLLPALYRLKDAQLAQSRNLRKDDEPTQLKSLRDQQAPLTPVQQEQLEQLAAKAARGPLESLLMLVEEQLTAIAEDLDQLYDDQFIETCAPWVVPYIGDLIGYQPVQGVPAVGSPRAEVAHTISYRRRKGTVLVLEQLARDVTGWGAHAVEFFKLLAVTQYMNHVRKHSYYAPNLRNWKPCEYMNTAFDATAHTVDVRRIAVQGGRHNIANIGIFLWSLKSYSLTKSNAPPVANDSGRCFRFSPLGRDIPLFNKPIPQGSDITAPAEPKNVANRLSRRVLCEDLAQTKFKNGIGVGPTYYGQGETQSLAIYVDGVFMPPSAIQVCNLGGPDKQWANLPVAAGKVAIDPELGRIALPPSTGSSKVQATFYYGFNADMGGGEYPRSTTIAVVAGQTIVRVPHDYATIQSALDDLAGDGAVEITDSGSYLAPGGLSVSIKDSGRIEVRAADGCRPTLILGASIEATGTARSAFALNGLAITYAQADSKANPSALIHVPDKNANQLGQIEITHCTLMPGWEANLPESPPQTDMDSVSLLVEIPRSRVAISKSILGGLRINGQTIASLNDCIVDATNPSAVAYIASFDADQKPQPGGTLTLEGSTVVGKIYSSQLALVSNSLVVARLSKGGSEAPPSAWSSPVRALRKQEGCIRFSYLPAGSVTPHRFHCVDEESGYPEPLLDSLRYGDPGYCKLTPATADAIRRGADDGGEMGAFHFVSGPIRESNLRLRIQEFLPLGLEFGIFYET